jgi:hypothetical protein
MQSAPWRCCGAPARRPRGAQRGSLFGFRASEDTKGLQAALEKYKRAVETSVQGGVLELGLKGFSQALIEIASRDSIKARRAQSAAQPRLTPRLARRLATWPVRDSRRQRGARLPRLSTLLLPCIAVLELRENDPMTDVKEAAIALGNVYRRAGDARLRLAARMQMVRQPLPFALGVCFTDPLSWRSICLR